MFSRIGKQEVSVLLLAVGALLTFSVALMTVPSDAQQGDPTGASGQGNEGCSEPRRVRTFNGSENQVTPAFNITGNTFRLRYDITDLDEDPGFDSFSIRPIGEDGIGVGQSVLVFDEGSGTENILEGPGSFTLEIETEGFEYDVTVEDCTGTAPGVSPSSPNSPPTTNQRPKDRVVRNTIPKKRLPPTGGPPAYAIVTGSIFAGVSLLGLGLVVRRRPRG